MTISESSFTPTTQPLRVAPSSQKGLEYSRYGVTGWLDGRRVGRRFKSHAEAVGEVSRLEVQALNKEGHRAVIIRLSDQQVRDAESAFTSVDFKGAITGH
jgi:hypothetical protein